MFFIRLLPLLLFAPAASVAGNPDYFQQELRYTIRVTLDDTRHTLDGYLRLEYTNHSPDTLPVIWMHLWANAFRDRRSAFCRQKLRDGSARFYFAGEEDLGFFEKIDFRADGQKAPWEIDSQNSDIAVIRLPAPLPPGGTVVIETPFFLKIPASFSRLGHVGTSYQMTQWYPKPAVYDARGWHPMPYLDIGEFYAEFGTYDVEITLPENYVVGATGTLQTLSEQVFLQKKEDETRREIARRAAETRFFEKKEKNAPPFPPSAAGLKTLHYTAGQVHDFAWFADKRFFVLKDTARLASGRTVDCWAMFTAENFDPWKKGVFYVRRAVEFYSHHVGEYPWPQATAVHSALSAGGGMEYPMITVIGSASSGKRLDGLVAHEVGHNWFYGLLASNEREHPWLDEGLNSYYEHRYLTRYYGSDNLADELTSLLPRWAYNPAVSGSVSENACLMLAREGADTPPDSPSDRFWNVAYGVQAYLKTSLCLEWLERSVGKARFDQAMQAYFERWKFRHPYPDDLRAAWRAAGLEADWFFQAMQTRQRFDPALTRAVQRGDSVYLSIRNKGSLPAPCSVTALRKGQPVQTLWFTAPAGGASTEAVLPAAGADRFVLDYERVALDFNRQNNSRRPGGLWPGVEPLRVKMLQPAQAPAHTLLGLCPWIGWNYYDKTMLGVMLYNPPFPARRFQFFLLPGYGLGSKQLVGLADLACTVVPAGGPVSKLTVGLAAKRFDYERNRGLDTYFRFFKITPRLRAELRSASPAFSHALELRTLLLGKEEAAFAADSPFVFLGEKLQRATLYELRYEATRHALPNPWELKAALEAQQYRTFESKTARYLRGSLEWKQRFFYDPKRKVTARLFAGYFLKNTQRGRGAVATSSLSNDIARASLALNPQGFNDYRFDQIFLGRSEASGFLSRQVSQSEGGFKNAFGPGFAALGNSNNFILALNLRADLPRRLPWGLPLKPYVDIGYYDAASLLQPGPAFSDQFLWSAGLLLEFFDGGLEVYFPILNAKALRERYAELGGNNYFRRISWSIRIGSVTPAGVARRLVR